MSLQKIEIRQVSNAKGKILTGGNTQVKIDGKRLRGVTSVTFQVDAGGIARLHLSMVGDISLKGKVDQGTYEAQYALGQFGPVAVEQKPLTLAKRIKLEARILKSKALELLNKVLKKPLNHEHS